jgi:hypothetical protein
MGLGTLLGPMGSRHRHNIRTYGHLGLGMLSRAVLFWSRGVFRPIKLGSKQQELLFLKLLINLDPLVALQVFVILTCKDL